MKKEGVVYINIKFDILQTFHTSILVSISKSYSVN